MFQLKPWSLRSYQINQLSLFSTIKTYYLFVLADNEVVFQEEDDVEEVSEITKESKDDVPEKSSLFQCRKSSRAKK